MIWKLPVTPRISYFIWRACGNYLATNYNLWKKKVRTSAICPICEIGEETVEHALLQCDWTLAVWYGMDIGYKVDRQKITSLDRLA